MSTLRPLAERLHDLSRAQVVRALALLQAVVIAATAFALVALTDVSWLGALATGLALSVVVNVAMRYSLVQFRTSATADGEGDGSAAASRHRVDEA